MKKLLKKFTLMAVATAGLLSISSCEKEEYIKTVERKFVCYEEQFWYSFSCYTDDVIRACTLEFDSAREEYLVKEEITGEIPKDFQTYDTIDVKITLKEVYPRGGGSPAVCGPIYKIKSIERI